MSKLLRTILTVILAVFLLMLAIRFIRTAFTLLVIAVPILAVAYVIRRLWGGGRSRQPEEECDEDCCFGRRFPRLSRLDKRIQALETLAVDGARKGEKL